MTKKVPAFSGYPVYTFTASCKIELGPVFACRSLHAVSIEVIKENFSGELNAINTFETYSIMPKYKSFLPRVSKLFLNDFTTLVAMRDVYFQRFPALKLVMIPQRRAINMFSDSDERDYMEKVITTDCRDEDILERFSAKYEIDPDAVACCQSYCNGKVDIIYEQSFEFREFDETVVSGLDLYGMID